MLVLSRKVNESIRIGDDVLITVVRWANGAVKLGVEAPKHVKVLRGELPRYEAAGGGVAMEAIGGTDAPPPAFHKPSFASAADALAGESSFTN